jgi:drug/metabolite transporter superfamily protein YnfA
MLGALGEFLLVLYRVVQTFQPSRFHRIYAAYGGVFSPFHEKMHKLLSSYSDNKMAFLLDVMTKTIELTHEESKK